MSDKYVSYLEIPSMLGLSKGDIVYLSSDIMGFAWNAKQHGEIFDTNQLIDAFLEKITEEGTLLIPTFNFDFSNKGIYDYKNTRSTTGALGNVALNRSDFRRTKHPMHSFCVAGKDQGLLCEMTNLNSFGKDGPFEYLRKENATQIMLGTDYQRSMTFVHYVETCVNVPYRFYKEFTGEYIDDNGEKSIRTYQYPARYLEYGSVEEFNKIGAILEKEHVAKAIMINQIPARIVRLGDSYSIIEKDAKENMCRNLYSFDIDRQEIWNMIE